jgi:N-acetylmuramoyl-L-alanine amidase
VVLIAACLVAIIGALSGHLGSGLFSGTASGPQAISPSTMATGACVALPPTSGDNHRTVFLDAGHGGVDPGGVGTTESGQQVDESTVNLAIELDTSDLLRAQGFRVVVSRTADTTVVRLTPADLSDGVLSATGVHDDVAARDVCANLAEADALVGIYMDSSTSSSDAGSVTVYDTARPFAAANQRLAQIVQTDVLSAMNSQGWQIPDDGALPDAGYGSSVGGDSGSTLADLAASYNHLLLIGPPLAGYFSTPSLMPGAVIEPLYLTDPFEGSIAATPGDQQAIAKGIAAAVEQFLAPAQSTPTS